MANFELNVSEVLGFKYQNFMSKQKSIAISDPDGYFTQRAALSTAIKETLAENLYKDLYALLIKGTSSIGQLKNGPPNYPPQKMNDVVIAVVSELASSLEDVIDLVYPASFQKIADAKLLIKTQGAVVGGTGSTTA